jgi:hypothetical protein
MPARNPRVDDYIAKAPDFARPILTHLREVVHSTCPQVEEAIKWRMPSFEYKGMLCGMAAFKEHAVFGFWKHELVVGGDRKAQDAMGSFGCLKSLGDLPSAKALAGYVRKAMKLNDEGVKAPRKKTRPKKAVPIHPEFRAALGRNSRALATLEGFPPSARAEYVEWIADAKADATRARRIAQAVEWLAEGKRRHWKYASC